MNADELASVAAQFGVARAQVERGLLISHLLGTWLRSSRIELCSSAGQLCHERIAGKSVASSVTIMIWASHQWWTVGSVTYRPDAVGSRSDVARDLDRVLRAVTRSLESSAASQPRTCELRSYCCRHVRSAASTT